MRGDGDVVYGILKEKKVMRSCLGYRVPSCRALSRGRGPHFGDLLNLVTDTVSRFGAENY